MNSISFVMKNFYKLTIKDARSIRCRKSYFVVYKSFYASRFTVFVRKYFAFCLPFEICDKINFFEQSIRVVCVYYLFFQIRGVSCPNLTLQRRSSRKCLLRRVMTTVVLIYRRAPRRNRTSGKRRVCRAYSKNFTGRAFLSR